MGVGLAAALNGCGSLEGTIVNGPSGPATLEKPTLGEFVGTGSSYYIGVTSHSLSWSLQSGTVDTFSISVYQGSNGVGTIQTPELKSVVIGPAH